MQQTQRKETKQVATSNWVSQEKSGEMMAGEVLSAVVDEICVRVVWGRDQGQDQGEGQDLREGRRGRDSRTSSRRQSHTRRSGCCFRFA